VCLFIPSKLKSVRLTYHTTHYFLFSFFTVFFFLNAEKGVVIFLITATVLYFVEKDNNPKYSSIPATMYITTILLTGQGIPEDDDLSIGGKIVVSISCVFSIGFIAVPTALLAWGFEPVGEKFIEKRKQQKKERKRLRTERAERLRAEGIEVKTESDSTDEYSLNLSSSSEEEEEG